MHALELDISRLDPKDRINPDDGQEAKSTTLAGSIVLEITKQRQLLCMSFGVPRAVLWLCPLFEFRQTRKRSGYWLEIGRHAQGVDSRT